MRLRVESQSSSGIPAETQEDDFAPQQIAESAIYTPTEKADFYQRYLERERRTGFKKLLSESENWPLNWRHALDEALAKTPLALGYAARLSTDDQIKFLNRMLALGYHDNRAAEAFVDLVSASSLNEIVSRLNELNHLGERSENDSPASGMYFMKRLAERAGELSPDAQKLFAKIVMDFNIFENDFRSNEAFRRQVLLAMFAQINPDALGIVLDELQSTYETSGLLRLLSGEFEATQE